jgi:hypothetical protein
MEVTTVVELSSAYARGKSPKKPPKEEAKDKAKDKKKAKDKRVPWPPKKCVAPSHSLAVATS